MLPYWLMFGVCVPLSLISAEQKDTRRGFERVYPIVIGMIITIMIGFRFHVGGDWGSYVNLQQLTAMVGLTHAIGHGDPGYVAINWITAQFGWPIWTVNLFCGTIFTVGLTAFCRDQPNPGLAFAVAVPYLVIVVAMGYTRQSVAIGFAMLAMLEVPRGNLVRFGLWMLAAAAFHKTAVVLVPIIALSMSRRPLIMAAWGGVLTLALFWMFLSSDLDRLMYGYVDSTYDSQGAAIRLSMTVVPAVIFLIKRHSFGISRAEYGLWRNLSFAAFGLLAAFLLLNSSTVVDSLALYLLPLQMFVFGRMPRLFGGGTANRMMILLVLVYSASVQFVWLTYASNARSWVPYQLYPISDDPYVR